MPRACNIMQSPPSEQLNFYDQHNISSSHSFIQLDRICATIAIQKLFHMLSINDECIWRLLTYIQHI